MLQIHALRKDFLIRGRGLGWLKSRRKCVLSGLELAVSPGEIVALGGDNGTGKTTLLKIAAGLLLPTSGTVRTKGTVGLTFADSRSFYWRLSCRENLQFFGALQRVSRETLDARIDGLALRFGLGARLDDPFMTLSSGLMQRLAIVRTLLADPDVWLLDEATRSVDRAGRRAVAQTLEDLVSRGGCAVVVSHDDPSQDTPIHRHLVLAEGQLREVTP